MSENTNNSDTYSHAQRNVLQSIELGNHLYVRGGKVTEAGKAWLKESLVKSGPELLDKLGPEMQTAAKEILKQKQEQK